ncbi:MAG: bifunctional serine/threonine-protein kinase/formylglycine-generating enzyme family protein [Puniceicoccaceae bacterium]
MSDQPTELPDESNSGKAFLPGQTIDRYRIIRLLGRGGMGEVYEVEHLDLGTRHALKLIHPDILSRGESQERFRREARVMAQLVHPNIVHVDDFSPSSTSGHAWLRMELVDGISLADRMKAAKGAMPEEEVLKVLKQILIGLAYAHYQGVVHRDLKPGNILAGSDRKIKITDFGLVRLAGEEWMQSQVQLTVARSMTIGSAPTQLGEDDQSSSQGTSTQALLGTFEYMSPEQKAGQVADARSDLYSVGLMAFRMLTSESTVGMELPSQLVDGIDPAWDDWVRKAIASRPERRFQSAGEMLEALPESDGSLNLAVSELSETAGNEEDSAEDPPPVNEIVEDESTEEFEPQVESTRDYTPPPEASPEPAVKPVEPSLSSKSFMWFVVIGLALAGGIWGIISWQQSQKPQRQTSINRSPTVAPSQPKTQPVQKPVSKPALVSSNSRVTSQPGPAEGSDWVVELPDGESVELKWIKSGSFTMGSPSNEKDRDSDEKQHSVRLSRGYWLGKYEVTQGDWEALMGNNPSRFKSSGKQAPVESVSWDDAMEFCRKLTERERAAGRLPEGMWYTLPTEAQWEYACRAGTATRFYTGNNDSDLDKAGWYDSNSGSKTHPVGQKQPNTWGLYDMHGNVWEWCLDWKDDYPAGTVTDPTGPSSGARRVLRGGGWDGDARLCRSAFRYRDSPGDSGYYLGFRLALSSTR